MRSTERTILIAVAIVGLLVAMWVAVISPKRSELRKLDEEVSTVRDTVAEQEALAAAAQQAQEGYASNYHRLVVLGKAVPSEADSASLLVQTSELAHRSGLEFRDLTLTASTSSEAAPTAAAETTADGETPEGESEADGTTPATPVAAPATEAAAAALPIGATVGPAGLPVMPYDLTFAGDFFGVADFISSIDSMVSSDSKRAGVDGRLVTIDGFALSADQTEGFPYLSAKMHVTTYVTPPDQGLTAGGTPEAPAAATTEPVAVSSP